VFAGTPLFFLYVPMNRMKNIFDEDLLGICSVKLNIAQFNNTFQQMVRRDMKYICRPQIKIQCRVRTPRFNF